MMCNRCYETMLFTSVLAVSLKNCKTVTFMTLTSFDPMPILRMLSLSLEKLE